MPRPRTRYLKGSLLASADEAIVVPIVKNEHSDDVPSPVPVTVAPAPSTNSGTHADEIVCTVDGCPDPYDSKNKLITDTEFFQTKRNDEDKDLKRLEEELAQTKVAFYRDRINESNKKIDALRQAINTATDEGYDCRAVLDTYAATFRSLLRKEESQRDSDTKALTRNLERVSDIQTQSLKARLVKNRRFGL
ncbi:hypothetical protein YASMINEVIRUS_108 [Yasminevirus sp. GU-2018]|uniref:Uncharacterized protein n=1 Tax=Yasminevirus sp. GU-2018 TaxID=2420051 RepID=A0A5K0U773_9VIRU|nr:hypothetical protein YASMINEVIRUS_108 [Yasminevirus sp. GU-2018]